MASSGIRSFIGVSQGADPAEYQSMLGIPTELAFTGVSTLMLVSTRFASVVSGVLLITIDRCNDLWED